MAAVESQRSLGEASENGVYVAFVEGTFATNVAYGEPNMKVLYVTEVESATVRVVDLDVSGVRRHSHHD